MVPNGLNMQYMRNPTIVYLVKIWNMGENLAFLARMVKSGLEKIFLKFLHALTMSFLLLNFDQKYKFKVVIPRPLFIIIFRPEMLNFHPYSILTGDTRVEFVIYCVLMQYT